MPSNGKKACQNSSGTKLIGQQQAMSNRVGLADLFAYASIFSIGSIPILFSMHNQFQAAWITTASGLQYRDLVAD